MCVLKHLGDTERTMEWLILCMERWVNRWIGVVSVIMPLFNLVNDWMGVGQTGHKALSRYFCDFQLSVEARSRESWLLANKRGSLRGLCDR